MWSEVETPNATIGQHIGECIGNVPGWIAPTEPGIWKLAMVEEPLFPPPNKERSGCFHLPGINNKFDRWRFSEGASPMVLVTLWAVRLGLLVALVSSLMPVARLRLPKAFDAS